MTSERLVTDRLGIAQSANTMNVVMGYQAGQVLLKALNSVQYSRLMWGAQTDAKIQIEIQRYG